MLAAFLDFFSTKSSKKTPKTATPRQEEKGEEQKKIPHQDLATRQAEIEKKRAWKRYLARGQLVRLIIKNMPAILQRAENDELYLKKITEGERATRFWRLLLSNPHYNLPSYIAGTAHPHTDAFSLLADQVYVNILNYRDSFLLILNMTYGLTLAQVGLTQFTGRQHTIPGSPLIENESSAIQHNLSASIDMFQRACRINHKLKATLKLRDILHSCQEDMHEFNSNNITTLQHTLFPALLRMRHDELNRLTLKLDNAIRITQAFYCMMMRSLLDVSIIEAARTLMATDPKELPVTAIRKRALELAAKHGALGLIICARTYYELSLYYLRQYQQYHDAGAGLLEEQAVKAQETAHKYAKSAMQAAQGAADSCDNEQNKRRIKNINFRITSWPLLFHAKDFNSFQKAIETGLSPCLLPTKGAPR